MTKATCILPLLAVVAVLTSCVSRTPVVDEFFAMDTVMDVSVYGVNAEAAVAAVQDEIYRLDRLFSAQNPDSDISYINENDGGMAEPETAAVIREALAVSEATDGAFDITLLPLTEAWGFTGKDYSIPDDAALSALLSRSGSAKVHVDDMDGVSFDVPGMKLDLGGIAKGYASDAAAELLRENNVKSAILSLGGNVYALGKKPGGGLWNVAIQDPDDLSAYVCVVKVADRAVITSGGYRRYFEQDGNTYQHILDPKTGRPADSGLKSVSVIGSRGILCDALSTAFFVMGKDAALTWWKSNPQQKVDLVLIENDGSITITNGIAKSFTCDSGYEVFK